MTERTGDSLAELKHSADQLKGLEEKLADRVGEFRGVLDRARKRLD